MARLPESRGVGTGAPTGARMATQADFFTLKGVIEDLLEAVGAREAVFQPADRTAIRGRNVGRGVAPRHGSDRLNR